MYKLTKQEDLLELLEVAEHRQLHPKEVDIIYNVILRLLTINSNMESIENFKRALFVLANYYDMRDSRNLLLTSLHICKLDNIENPYTTFKINECLNMIGDFVITPELKKVWKNVLSISYIYLSNETSKSVNLETMLEVLRLSTTTHVFEKSPFYLLLYSNSQKSQDALLQKKLEELLEILEDEFLAINYFSFINWIFA
jgi:hypothetical protein